MCDLRLEPDDLSPQSVRARFKQRFPRQKSGIWQAVCQIFNEVTAALTGVDANHECAHKTSTDNSSRTPEFRVDMYQGGIR